jgi:TRAP-type mannitol/chloroaromatic compound transport system permease large subunit
MTSAGPTVAVEGVGQIPAHFYAWFWGFAVGSALLLLIYFWRMDGEQLEILKELIVSVVPLGVLTVIVLAVILFGIMTATESAAVGAVGALYLAVMARYARQVWWWSLVGVIIGVGLGWWQGEDWASLIVAGSIGGTLAGTIVPGLWNLRTSPELRTNLKQATFLTAKTTAMVCWLFVGSGLFSAVFALHGGQGLIERWVLSLNLSPLGFQFTAQMIIFLLGWPLEWTEIIVIFCPIFIPLLSHFHIDPILFGTMVAVNLQAAFLSPPVAMSAFYLKGVSPKHVTLNQIFAGMMPYMIIVCICLVFMYIWPGMTLWLPEFLYGR